MRNRLRDYLTDALYVRIRPDLLSVRGVITKSHYEDEPWVAINSKGRQEIVMIGKAARERGEGHGVVLCNGFDHPRSIISDFTIAEATLRRFIRELGRGRPRKILRLRPAMVIHPLTRLEGGLTMVEERALLELAIAVGACHGKAMVYTGPELTDEDVLAFDFSSRSSRRKK